VPSAPSDGPSSEGPRRIVVAIDGPSGSGKSSVSRRVAARLGLAFLDTGAIYRALTWWCLDQGVDLGSPSKPADPATEATVAALARNFPLEIGTDPADPVVRVDGRDVGAAIREPRISAAVSAVATNLQVRETLLEIQRRLIAAGSHGVVAEGRDITTVVAPDADVRILLTADTQARLARRSAELHGSTDAAALEATRDQVIRRDRDDSAVSSFMTAAEGVHTIDSSALGFDEVVDAVLAEVAERTGVRPSGVRA
jgi:cytidylate kinase